MNTHLTIPRAMPASGPPTWPGARWVGVVDLPVPRSGALALAEVDGYGWARLLVREATVARGFVELPILRGAVDCGELAVAVEALRAAGPRAAARTVSAATVVVCTRDRAAQLATALPALLALDPPATEILVIDNAPRDRSTECVVAALGEDRVRYVREDGPGLARARNRALLEARHDIVAFTDDDVRVDTGWLDGLLRGFGHGADVACVSGLVAGGELRTPTQAAFEHRVGWAATSGRVFRASAPPADLPLFPYQVGVYGTGASFAVRRREILTLGGFDEALGAGSPSRGGEDIDLFFRVIAAGHALAYEPSAVAWHRHRADAGALLEQASGYGLGLGAWLGKIARDRRALWPALRRALGAMRRLATLGSDAGSAPDDELRAELGRARRAELRAVLRGMVGYGRARRAARRNRLLDGGAR